MPNCSRAGRHQVIRRLSGADLFRADGFSRPFCEADVIERLTQRTPSTIMNVAGRRAAPRTRSRGTVLPIRIYPLMAKPSDSPGAIGGLWRRSTVGAVRPGNYTVSPSSNFQQHFGRTSQVFQRGIRQRVRGPRECRVNIRECDNDALAYSPSHRGFRRTVPIWVRAAAGLTALAISCCLSRRRSRRAPTNSRRRSPWSGNIPAPTSATIPLRR